MLPSFLLALREGVEAALMIGIVLGVLRKLNRTELNRSVWAGAGMAGLASLLIAVMLRLIGSELEGRAEQVFEGVSMLLAAGVLTWMIFWMARQSRSHSRDLEQRVRRSLSSTSRWAIFGLSFLAVFREGMELALFLLAAGMTATAVQSILGTVLGLLSAAGLGWLFFTSTRRLPVSAFFRVTNIFLILFAAGLVAHGVHEFNEAGLIPPVIETVYNLSGILSDSSLPGQILATLFGYSSAPSLTQLLAYLIYFGSLLLTLRFTFHQPVASVGD
jgi:high-affinity iron transporter